MKESLGDLILKRIKEKGITQQYVADKMGVARQIINQLPLRKNFDYEFLQKLSEVVGVDFTKYYIGVVSLQNEEETEDAEIVDSSKLNNLITLSLSFSIKGTSDVYGALPELIRLFEIEAIKRGFELT